MTRRERYSEFSEFAEREGIRGKSTMNLAPLVDQPNGFHVREWLQDEAKSPYGPLARVVTGKPYNQMLATRTNQRHLVHRSS